MSLFEKQGGKEMGTIRIKDNEAKLVAEIEPEYGGMVTRLQLDGKDILKFESGTLATAPISAGGIPILFPCPSKTKEDRYALNGKEYHMPLHGFVKNSAYAVKSVSQNAVTVWIDGGKSTREANYPFDFRMEIEYRVEGETLRVSAKITNDSDEKMPHYLGWHPYFLATDKTKLTLTHSMRKHYNYIECVDEETIKEIDLSQSWDDVFHDPQEKEFKLRNDADGYEARVLLDDAHSVLVICSVLENCVCLEPWCGLPDSINNGRYVKWIEPGDTQEYQWAIQVSLI